MGDGNPVTDVRGRRRHGDRVRRGSSQGTTLEDELVAPERSWPSAGQHPLVTQMSAAGEGGGKCPDDFSVVLKLLPN